MKPNYLRIQGQLEGYNCPSVAGFDSTITMPSGFQIEIFLMGGPIDLTLSEDSRIITLYNSNVPACSGRAIRNHSNVIRPMTMMSIIAMIIPMIDRRYVK